MIFHHSLRPLKYMPLLLALFISHAAGADPHPFSLGAGAGPKSPVEIALVKESLAIRVGLRSADVTADIDLQNQGLAHAFEVGFPCENGVKAQSQVALDCGTPIRVTVNGKRRETTKREVNGACEYVWKMEFAAGQRTKLRVAYTTRLVNDRYDAPMYGALLLLYRLSTGADWAGPIKTLDMTVQLPTDAIAWIGPPGYTRTPKQIEWHLTDYEPTSELMILFHPEFIGYFEKADKKLSVLKGEARERLAGEYRERVKRFAANGESMQEVMAHLLPIFHLPPPKDGFRETLAESVKLMERQLAK